MLNHRLGAGGVLPGHCQILAGWSRAARTNAALSAPEGRSRGSRIYRGATLALEGSSFLLAAAVSLAIAQLIQTVLLGGWLSWRNPPVVRATFHLWRPSLFAGFMGAAASVGWFTAFAIEPAAHVRTLALIELLFSYVVSRKIFREKLTTLELSGLALLTAGLIVVTLGR